MDTLIHCIWWSKISSTLLLRTTRPYFDEAAHPLLLNMKTAQAGVILCIIVNSAVFTPWADNIALPQLGTRDPDSEATIIFLEETFILSKS